MIAFHNAAALTPPPPSPGGLGPPSPEKFPRPVPKMMPRPPPSAKRQHTPEQKAALCQLSEAILKDPPDRHEVERALASGRAAGLRPVELLEAREEALRAAARQRAREALKRAVAAKEEEGLRRAVTLADEAFLDSREMAAALALMEEIEAKAKLAGGDASPEARARAAVVLRLRRAIKSRDFEELTGSIRDAERAGLAIRSQRALLAEARMTLKLVASRRQAVVKRRSRGTDDADTVPTSSTCSAAGTAPSW